MGGEDGSGAHHLQCLAEGEAVTDQVADPLESEESGVAFVGVVHLGQRCAGQLTERLDGAHPADAEQDLLQQPMLPAAAVQSIGDRPQRLFVLGNVGVE